MPHRQASIVLTIDHLHPTRNATTRMLHGTIEELKRRAVMIIREFASIRGVSPLAVNWSLEKLA